MELEMDDDYSGLAMSPPSFKTKLKHSLFFSCCFRRRQLRQSHRQVFDSSPPSDGVTMSDDSKPTVIWLKKKVSHHLKDDIKGKCVTVFSRIGNGSSKHKRHSSAEFRYDPLSYSLNFEDGLLDDDDDEASLRNFSSRLPSSSLPVKAMSPVREITAVS